MAGVLAFFCTKDHTVCVGLHFGLVVVLLGLLRMLALISTRKTHPSDQEGRLLSLKVAQVGGPSG